MPKLVRYLRTSDETTALAPKIRRFRPTLVTSPTTQTDATLAEIYNVIISAPGSRREALLDVRRKWPTLTYLELECIVLPAVHANDRAFETSRRREVLSFPDAWEATRHGMTVGEKRRMFHAYARMPRVRLPWRPEAEVRGGYHLLAGRMADLSARRAGSDDEADVRAFMDGLDKAEATFRLVFPNISKHEKDGILEPLLDDNWTAMPWEDAWRSEFGFDWSYEDVQERIERFEGARQDDTSDCWPFPSWKAKPIGG